MIKAVKAAFFYGVNMAIEYFNLGIFAAVHGLNGELVLKHELGKKTSLKGLEVIFLEDRENQFLPWFIEKTKIKNEKEVYVKLEGVSTREAAIPFARKKAWIPEPDFKKLAAKSAPAGLLGYEVIDGEKNLGTIQSLIEQPHQLLCTTLFQGKELMIPLHEESLRKIDHKKKIVYVELPEGLLEIYL